MDVVALSNPYPRQKGGRFGPGPGKAAGGSGKGSGEGKAPAAKSGGASKGKAGGGASETRQLHQAYKDWLSGRAFVRNGNYRVHDLTPHGYKARSSKPASWSKLVKSRYSDSMDFHQAAEAYGAKHPVKTVRSGMGLPVGFSEVDYMAMKLADTWQPTDLTTVRLTDGGDGFKRSWIMLLPEGKFEHPRFGELDLTHKTLTEMVQNFKANARGIEIALDYDHKASDGDSRAPGWLEDMQVRPAKGETPAGLWGLVRWTPLGLKDIQDQIYRYVSAEFKEDYKDDVSGEQYKNVIIGATLTNRPFMKQMPAVKLKDYSKAERDAMDESDFAGPDETYPIKTQADVEHAAELVGMSKHASAAAIKANVKRIAKRKGFTLPKAWQDEDSSDSGSTAASETEMPMATRTSRKLADDAEDLPAEDEQELDAPEEDELPADDDEGEDESEDSSESSDGDGEEEEEEEDEPQEASTLSEMMEHITGRKTLAAPTAKKGRKALPKPSADDEEDAADGGDDEDTELDDAEEYDEVSVSPVHIPGEMKIARGKAKAAAKTAPKKMSESVILAEQVAQLTAQLSEAQSEIKTLREREFTHSVGVHLAEMTKHIRVSDGTDNQFALPRSFRKVYEAYMFSEGVKLSEDSLDKLNGLILHALRVGTVPLTSMASHVEQPAGVVSLDDRRPRVTSKDPGEASKQRLAEAKAIALSEGKNFDELEYDDKIAFIGRVRGRDGHGEPVA